MFVGGMWVVFFYLSDPRLRGHKVSWATALSLRKIEASGLLNRTQLDSAPISVVLDTMDLAGSASTIKSAAGWLLDKCDRISRSRAPSEIWLGYICDISTCHHGTNTGPCQFGSDVSTINTKQR